MLSKTCSKEERSRKSQRAENELISFSNISYSAYSSIYSSARLWPWSDDGIRYFGHSLQYEMKGFGSRSLAMSKEALAVPHSGFVSG
jgi:hypothetical protein